MCLAAVQQRGLALDFASATTRAVRQHGHALLYVDEPLRRGNFRAKTQVLDCLSHIPRNRSRNGRPQQRARYSDGEKGNKMFETPVVANGVILRLDDSRATPFPIPPTKG